MHRLFIMILGLSILFEGFGVAGAASEQAMKLRGTNGLSAYTPSDGFLAGNFVADEVEPWFVFGKVRDFVAARSCPATWLIEDGERKRLEARAPHSDPFEYTLYLEEDCPGRVAYFVFVDRSEANATQWMEWRKQFHKSKAEPQYGVVKAGLEQAAQNGFPVSGELRFVEINGDLQLKKPEDLLIGELKFQPLYDLKQGRAVAR